MRLLVLAGALAVASTTVSWTARAQSLPNVNGIKQTTQRAVNKTNTHTLAMTNVDSAANAAKAPAAKPAPNRASAAAKRPVESPADTARAHGVRATAAATGMRPGIEMDTAGKVVLR